MTDNNAAPAKPQVGTVAPVEVTSIWRHPLVILTSLIAVVPAVLAVLVQLQQLPGLPTNVTAWIATAIAVLTALITILRALGLLGAPVISPAAAAKVIQTTPPNQ